MEIVLPDNPVDLKKMTFYNIDFSKRDYHTILLTGNEAEDKIKLQYAQLELRRIVQENDSVKGLHLIFGNGMKYWAMVKAFDICNQENIFSFVWYKNDLWALHKPIVNNLDSVTDEFECLLCGDAPAIESNFKEKFIDQVKLNLEEIIFFIQNIKFFWPSAILFLVMLISTIWRFIKY
ncbi:MAG: hypothetical protein ACXWEY_05415 [Bacteroidia bacterium]